MKFDELKKLHQKKYREQFGHYLIEGEHLVLELIKAAEIRADLRASTIYISEDHAPIESSLAIQVISNKQMAELTETDSPQGIVALVPIVPTTTPVDGQTRETTICLYEIQDPGNLGTILRSLAWFGGFRCLLTTNSVDLYNGKVLRASLGAHWHVPIETEVKVASLPARFSKIARLDMHGKSTRDESFRDFDCYLFGNEARGLPRSVIDGVPTTPFTITGLRTIESLNLASAVNVCAYELRR
ncbi:MAG: RNA methyltransferase [Gammaproteobacteria bacterium]|nr:RNA methyltransferase [Gammaproteobacteria bacterium]